MNQQRQIVAMMTFAVVFALIGHGSKIAKGTNSNSLPVNGGDVKILLGGAVGTVLLVLLGEAGDSGATFAKGIAVITLISSALINGQEVFGGISHLTAKKTPAPKLITTPKVG
jgi:hypothetical protein